MFSDAVALKFDAYSAVNYSLYDVQCYGNESVLYLECNISLTQNCNLLSHFVGVGCLGGTYVSS